MNRKEFAIKWGNVIERQKANYFLPIDKTDELLADLDEVIKSELPSAEGAKEILQKYMNDFTVKVYNDEPYVEYTEAIQAMQEFAALNREKNLRNELIKFMDFFNSLNPYDYILERDIDDYLKNREK